MQTKTLADSNFLKVAPIRQFIFIMEQMVLLVW